MTQYITYGPIVGVTASLISSSNVASLLSPILVNSHSVSVNWDSWSSRTTSGGGINWCATYTDGWMEQGGYVPTTSMGSWSSLSIPFGWSFLGNPVYINCQACQSSTTGGDHGIYGVFNIDSSGFTYCHGGSGAASTGIYWVAKGIDPNWVEPEPTPTGDAYVDGDTLYTGDSVTNDTVNIIGGAVNNNILEL